MARADEEKMSFAGKVAEVVVGHGRQQGSCSKAHSGTQCSADGPTDVKRQRGKSEMCAAVCGRAKACRGEAATRMTDASVGAPREGTMK